MTEDLEAIEKAVHISEVEKSAYTVRWRLSDDMLRELRVLLLRYRPRKILETGPGASTILLLRYSEATSAVYVGIDHVSTWHDAHIRELVRLDLTPEYNYSVPIVDAYYDTERLPEFPRGPYDLLLLDGPPESSDRSSPAAIAFLRGLVGPRTIIVQDDTHRSVERSIIPLLRKITGEGMIPGRVYDVRDSNITTRVTTVFVPVACDDTD